MLLRLHILALPHISAAHPPALERHTARDGTERQAQQIRFRRIQSGRRLALLSASPWRISAAPPKCLASVTGCGSRCGSKAIRPRRATGLNSHLHSSSPDLARSNSGLLFPGSRISEDRNLSESDAISGPQGRRRSPRLSPLKRRRSRRLNARRRGWRRTRLRHRRPRPCPYSLRSLRDRQSGRGRVPAFGRKDTRNRRAPYVPRRR